IGGTEIRKIEIDILPTIPTRLGFEFEFPFLIATMDREGLRGAMEAKRGTENECQVTLMASPRDPQRATTETFAEGQTEPIVAAAIPALSQNCRLVLTH